MQNVEAIMLIENLDDSIFGISFDELENGLMNLEAGQMLTGKKAESPVL